MVKSVFNINNNGKNTLFGNTSTNILSAIPQYTIPNNDQKPFDFNTQIRNITQKLNSIIYYGNNLSIEIMKEEYNIILYELQKLKNMSFEENNYNIVLQNIISTFETLLSIYNLYISRNEDEYNIPQLTYDHLKCLDTFIIELYDEKCPDSIPNHNNRWNVDLEAALFSLYKNVGKKIGDLSKLLSLGKYTELQNQLNYELYTSLSVSLYNENYDKSIGYTNLRNILYYNLEGLFKIVLLTETHADEIENLKSQIENLKNPKQSVFSTYAQNKIVAEIRPEIITYISLYGFPEGGVFDAEKLAEIIDQK